MDKKELAHKSFDYLEGLVTFSRLWVTDEKDFMQVADMLAPIRDIEWFNKLTFKQQTLINDIGIKLMELECAFKKK